MSKIVTSEVNERRHRVIIDRHDLKHIVGEAIAKELGIRHAAPGQTWDFSFKDEMEGSPPATRSGQAALSMWLKT